MLEDLTSKEITEWYAYDRLEPINTEYRDDLRMGITTSSLINFFRGVYSKKNTKPKMTSPNDFIPKFDIRKQEDDKKVQEKLRAYFSKNKE